MEYNLFHMENIIFRLARSNDIDAIMAIIADAQEFMKSQRSGQWQDGHPRRAAIIDDIEHEHYYVIEAQGIVVGGLAILDYEADYESLLEGTWMRHGRYLVIHRFAIDSQYAGKGYAKFALAQVDNMAGDLGISSIRVDTHEKNKPMVNLLLGAGYQQIGVVMLRNFKRRLAFEKDL